MVRGLSQMRLDATAGLDDRHVADAAHADQAGGSRDRDPAAAPSWERSGRLDGGSSRPLTPAASRREVAGDHDDHRAERRSATVKACSGAAISPALGRQLAGRRASFR